MRAVVYSKTGGPDVLQLVERPVREPGAGEVRVRVQVSGVNPTDWKARRGPRESAELPFPEVVPNQDGAGTIDAVGAGVAADRVGERVWLWEAAWERAEGTAQEFVVLPGSQAARLPDGLSFDVGASLGIPALTAHRCLTVSDLGPRRLEPGALTGQTVLVAGGAGAVGHAAIQLARWADARVISTVSSDQKAGLARAAGADHVINYRNGDAREEILALAPEGVDTVVEVAAAANAGLDEAVLGANGIVAAYAGIEQRFASKCGVPARRNARHVESLVAHLPHQFARSFNRFGDHRIVIGVAHRLERHRSEQIGGLDTAERTVGVLMIQHPLLRGRDRVPPQLADRMTSVDAE